MSGHYPGWTSMVEGIPWSGRNLPPKILMSCRAMSYPMNFNVATITTERAPVDFARNHMCKAAREINAKYVVFWDEDVIRPPQAIRELVYRMEHVSDAAVIGGVVTLKAEPAEPMIFKTIGGGPYWDWKAGEFFPIRGIGMGCTIIRVAALDDIEEPWFKTVNDYEKLMEGIAATEQWTEDLYFCDKIVKTKKWQIYCDGSLLCAHVDLNTGKEYGLPADSKPMRHLLTPKGKKKILDVGSGASPLKTNEGSVVTFDKDETVKPDYRGDCRRLPFGAGSFDIVHCSHMLEQLTLEDADEALREMKRVVAPKGELRLTVSNLDWLADRIKSGSVDATVIGTLYGDNQRSAYTSAMIRKKFEELSFKHIDVQGKGSDLVCVATDG